MGNFYTDVVQQDVRFHSPDECRDLLMLEPVTRAAVQAIIADAANLEPPIRLIVTETFRSQARQQKLYAQGATQLNGLTPATIGVHHFGCAADFAKVINGSASWAGNWAFLGELCERHGLIWGGDWGQPGIKHSFLDFDHCQRVSVAAQSDLFAMKFYPDESYSPYVLPTPKPVT